MSKKLKLLYKKSLCEVLFLLEVECYKSIGLVKNKIKVFKAIQNFSHRNQTNDTF